MSDDNHAKILELYRQKDALRTGLKYAAECLFRIEETLGQSPIGRDIAADISEDMRHMEEASGRLVLWIRKAEEGAQ
jgi:hypothetical protein